MGMKPPGKIANLALGVSLGSGTYPDLSLLDYAVELNSKQPFRMNLLHCWSSLGMVDTLGNA